MSSQETSAHSDNEISITFDGFAGARLGWGAFWLAVLAALPFFVNLFLAQAWGSEYRWMDVAADILANGNWLEPRLGGVFYGDKPMLSYWVVAVLARLAGGMSEGVARLPSAVSGLLTVVLTAWMAGRIFGRHAAALAAWVLATSFSFLFWSRAASADLLSLFFMLAAMALYLEGVLAFRPWQPILFFVCIALGGQAKGMPAVLLPLGLAGLDSLCFRRALLRRQFFWILSGLALGLILYFLPFILSYAERGDWRMLYLMWRENFVRGFSAFDHRASPFYYFYTLPAMFMPWGLLLPGALVWSIARWRRHAGWRFALMAFALIFIFFTASESRRSYYILPIFPFCAMLVAGYISDPGIWRPAPGRLTRLAQWGLFVPCYCLGVLVALALLLLCVGYFVDGQGVLGLFGATIRNVPCFPALVLALLAGLVLFVLGIGRGRFKYLAGCHVLTAFLGMVYYVGAVEPLRAAGLTERQFAHEVRQQYPNIVPVYYDEGNDTLCFYLGAGTMVADNDVLLDLINAGLNPALVVCESEDFEKLRDFAPLQTTVLLKAMNPGFQPLLQPEPEYFLVRAEKK